MQPSKQQANTPLADRSESTDSYSEFRMFEALKQLDPNASERIESKYKDVLVTRAAADAPGGHRLDGTALDVATESRLAHLRGELSEAIIGSVHRVQASTNSVGQSRR